MRRQAAIQTISESSIPRVSKNAFVEPVPERRPPTRLAEAGTAEYLPPIKPTGNLTKNLAQHLTREIFLANPEGPQTSDGQPSAFIPSSSALDNVIARSLETTNVPSVELSDFNAEVPDSDIVIVSTKKLEDLLEYAISADSILSDTILSPEFQELTEQEPSFQAISAVQLTLERALKKLKSTPVPSALAEFHKSQVALLADQKKLLDVLTADSNDPLRTLVTIQNLSDEIDNILKRDLQNLENELQKLNFQTISSDDNDGRALGILKTLFGIQKAHAIIFVPIDCLGPKCLAAQAVQIKIAGFLATQVVAQKATLVTTKGTWFHRIWTWAKLILRQQLQNALIQQIQRDAVNWIKGGGNPKFITNWQNFFGDIFNKAAGAAIQQIVPGLCRPFGPLFRVALRPAGQPFVNFGTCTLDSVVGNLRNFYNDFQTGGWVAYGATFQPNNNFFGGIITSHDESVKAATKATGAAKSKSISGFLGTEVCGDGSTAQQGVCDDGSEPFVTTPGETVANVLGNALDSNAKLIVNADAITGLISAVTNAALSRLISVGVSGISGLVPSSGDPGGISEGPPPPTPSPTPLPSPTPSPTPTPSPPPPGPGGGPTTCSPSTQTVASGEAASLSAAGGDGENYSWSAPGGTPFFSRGPTFSVTYSVTGFHTVSVFSPGFPAFFCTVSVE